MATVEHSYPDFRAVPTAVASDSLLRRIALSLLVLSPTYWAAVKREADLLISAYGFSRAAQYAQEESDDALSGAWASFMRRVGGAIAKRAQHA
ncbi:MAG: hypothetical protein JSR45_17050 [Proteobacteria bacterium]|nr:hypothetical protein [Pseudomonadota bacterium]